jgi:hypothetical protein
MTHRRIVAPFCSAVDWPAFVLLELLSLLLPPQAATTRASAAVAIHAGTAIFLRTILSPPPKTILVECGTFE